MILESYEDLKSIRLNYQERKIVYASGSFDLISAGHVLFFENSKNLGDLLIVAVASDEALRDNKGDKRPIIRQDARIKLIDSLKPVDYTFINTKKDLSDLENIFSLLKPAVYTMTEDAFDMETRRKYSDKFGVEMVVLERSKKFADITTTTIIEKIKRLY